MDERAALELKIAEIDNHLTSVNAEIKDLTRQQSKLISQKQSLNNKLKSFHAPKVDWLNETFPWTKTIRSCLDEKFHMKEFREFQIETINVTMSRKDCILVMPTGGGKSLCFQLPAVVCDGYALVISPLLSLMEDQIIALKKLGIKAAMLNSFSSKQHVSEIHKQMITSNSPFKLLYVTPEKLAKSKRFMAKLEKAYSLGLVNRIVIDEVHCTSSWGNDFRPDYKYLGILKRQFPNLPILGLTATASNNILDDIKDILSLEDCMVFKASFNRPNLFYEVNHCCLTHNKLVSQIASRINEQFKGDSGIVYCFSRKDSHDVSMELCNHGIISRCYHADVPCDIKTKVHEGWSKGDIQVIVATVAFGMGIDKSNVRFVIHYSISKSIENYYQESGRAGRDNQPAWCILYFRFADVFRLAALVFHEKTGLQKLHSMLRYCVTRDTCRRNLIGRDFEEDWVSSGCKQMCDCCAGNKVHQSEVLSCDVETVVSILRGADSQDERLTPLKLIDTWLGKGKASLRPSTICTYTRSHCEEIVSRLILDDVVSEDFHFTPYSTITYIVVGFKYKVEGFPGQKLKEVHGKRKMVDSAREMSKKQKLSSEAIVIE